MRVLHVIPSMSPEWGGPTVAVAGLTAALTRLGVECEIVTTQGQRVGPAPIQVPGVPLHCFSTGSLASGWTAFSGGAARFLATEMSGFALVHVHELWHYPGLVAFYAARRHGAPYVLSLRGELDPVRLRHHRVRKWLYLRAIQDRILKAADAVHTLTLSEEEAFRARGLETRVFRVPNGINVSPPAKPSATASFLARHPQLAGKRVILFLGRLQAIKGLDLLERSFATVAARFPDAVLLVAGRDEDGSGRRAEAGLKAAGLAERIVFAGFLTGADKQAALECAALFVLPSYSEGFSNAVLEALAAGLPVVITEQCHFPEVAERHAGFVVQTKAAPVAGAIGALLADAGLRARMGGNGRTLVAAHYSWPVLAERFAHIYQTLTKRP